ncbi:tetratricopeptide repeat protein [Myxococcota bacterium]|nr:tetratricopeptide repeat protein [Myxococcota bacterium]
MRVLLRDRHPDRALAVLDELEADAAALDLAELARLRGLGEHGIGRYADAAKSFAKAIELGHRDDATWLALVDAELLAGRPGAALSRLAEAPPTATASRRARTIEAHAHHALGARVKALEVIEDCRARFGADVTLERLEVRVLLELGLHHSAVAAATRRLERDDADPQEALAIAALLSSSRAPRRAVDLLEAAVIRFPDSRPLREGLAKAWLAAGETATAARVLGPIVLEDPAVARVAAELARRAGRTADAIRINGLVEAPADKARQRLELLVEAERFGQAVALDARLARLGLLDDQKTTYALAYAHWAAGDRRRLEELLTSLTEPELFDRVVAIRRALEACDQDVWQCP